jgi:hypothetical protein
MNAHDKTQSKGIPTGWAGVAMVAVSYLSLINLRGIWTGGEGFLRVLDLLAGEIIGFNTMSNGLPGLIGAFAGLLGATGIALCVVSLFKKSESAIAAGMLGIALFGIKGVVIVLAMK